MIDISIEHHGSLYAFRPLTEKGRQWLSEDVQSESYQWLGEALVVEHRFAGALAQAALDDGLSIV